MSRSLKEIVREFYQKGKTDYWLPPLVIHNQRGRIKNGDTVVFCCRRGEREIQLTESFVEPHFENFPRQYLKDLLFVPMTLYHEKFTQLKPIFQPVIPANTLGEILSRSGKRQLAASESEKEAHVTYFFNGRKNLRLPNQTVKILPSYKAYEKHPEMKSRELAVEVVTSLADQDFIIVNFPAGDIIGHLPDWDLKVKAIEVVDEALGLVVKEASKQGYRLLITADHGLIEKGWDETGNPNVSHTTAKVPLILVDPKLNLEGEGPLSLADIAPTVLKLMGIPIPTEMTGTPLVKGDVDPAKVLLVILDGWGIGELDPALNPIKAAHTPVFDSLFTTYSNLKLAASGFTVGLPAGNSGNSETGHLTIGAGRVIEQDGLRVEKATKAGFQDSQVLQEAISRTLEKDRVLHLIALLSEASSHGSIHEGLAIKALAEKSGVAQVFLHLIADGRSAPPYGSLEILESQKLIAEDSNVVTIVGRGYALDRAGEYEQRTKPTYEALTLGKGTSYHF